ncbi:MAG: OmpH family outer membrane protein [Syntrophorhabdales bacterium]|jgi:outer membrane protein
MRIFAISVSLLALVLAPFAVGAQAPAVRIGYVDLQRVMVESDRGKEARKALTEELEKRKKEVSQRQEDLQKMKDTLEKQVAMITPEARAEKEKQYQTKLKDYQRITNDYQAELQQKDQEYIQKILKDLEEVIKGMGDSEKYTFILEKTQGGILFASPSADITDKVIGLYNEWSRKKAPPGPAKK